tara:strand:- start:819 stop:2987 length:2169 start_codon:yes stop_codon:yes gene_type:complete
MTRPHVAPGAVFAFCVVLYLAAAAALTWVATAQPWLGLRLGVVGQSVIVSDVAHGSAMDRGLIGRPLINLSGSNQPAIPVTPLDLIEEPDGIGDQGTLRRFFDRQDQLYVALRSGAVILTFDQVEGPESVRVQAHKNRPIADLPAKFWTQIFVAFVGMLIGAWVVCLRPHERAGWLFLLSGIGLAFASASAAIYSSRELALSLTVYSVASRANAFGSLLFGIGMVTLFLSYPRRIVPKPVLWLPTILIGACISVVLGPSWPDNLNRAQDFIAMIMAALLLVIAAQVAANRRDPAARAMLGWLGVSVAVGAGGFVLTSTLPSLLGLAPVIEQSTAFLFFLIIYAGIALAVTRYRLFDLANWSFGFLFYGLGVALLLGLDAALIYGLSLGRAPAFGIALAAICMIYLPLRDKVWLLLKRNREIPAEELYRRVTEIAHARGPEDRQRLLRKFWSDIFNPLSIKDQVASTTYTELRDDGRILTLASVGKLPALSLELAGQGSRLFSSRDLVRAEGILSLIDASLSQHETYLQAVSEERLRINRDMHDNIGVLLLSALHTGPRERKDLLIRQTLTDLRELISNPDQSDWDLRELLADLRAEIITHFGAAHITITWQTDEINIGRISHRLAHALRAFLREGTSNVLRHSGATEANVQINLKSHGLQLTLTDNGSGFDRSVASLGNGFRNLRNRFAQQQGNFSFSTGARGTILTAFLPLTCIPKEAAAK